MPKRMLRENLEPFNEDEPFYKFRVPFDDGHWNKILAVIFAMLDREIGTEQDV